jgi:hypothetical protein
MPPTLSSRGRLARDKARELIAAPTDGTMRRRGCNLHLEMIPMISTHPVFTTQPAWLPRLMTHVDGQADGCWLWTGACNRRGYGQIGIDYHTVYAHRAVYIAMIGPIPDGMNVCHHCDVPSCVNPEHLFLGTHTDNRHDAMRKGHVACGIHHGRYTHPESTARGSRNGQAKLTETDALAILASEASTSSLSRRFNVSRYVIQRVRNGRSWKHVRALPDKEA